ncbi:hypothetical protein, partial [Mesorhizobium sp. WSM2561]|uniref:hypothetical protein n=1 Tax=Mesorhizobium sp. WSM2561 TaxID=1040985 RepID=UPI001AEC3C3C
HCRLMPDKEAAVRGYCESASRHQAPGRCDASRLERWIAANDVFCPSSCNGFKDDRQAMGCRIPQ